MVIWSITILYPAVIVGQPVMASLMNIGKAFRVIEIYYFVAYVQRFMLCNHECLPINVYSSFTCLAAG